MGNDTAAVLAAISSAVTAAALAGAGSGPTPANAATAAWYARLRKPAFTKPGPVFGAARVGIRLLRLRVT